MLIKLILLFLLVLGSCATPDMWRADEHIRMLGRCQVACKRNGMRSYDVYSAECACYPGR